MRSVLNGCIKNPLSFWFASQLRLQRALRWEVIVTAGNICTFTPRHEKHVVNLWAW